MRPQKWHKSHKVHKPLVLSVPFCGRIVSDFEVLTPFERFAFRLVRRMNQGAWKRFWTWCQSTRRRLDPSFHLQHHERLRPRARRGCVARAPLLLVANHRSFFDMYAVSTVLFRSTQLAQATFFPVRGRFFYQSPLGLLVNLIMGWWSMYPPFFATGDNPIPEKRAFDKFSFRSADRPCASRGRATSSVFIRKERATRVTIRIRFCARSRAWES